MIEIIKLLLPLSIVIVVNIALGLYYKIGITNIAFDKHVLLNGIAKAVIVAGAFVGLAFVFDTVSLGDLNINPKIIMLTAIATYAVKSCDNLVKIFGITLPTKKA